MTGGGWDEKHRKEKKYYRRMGGTGNENELFIQAWEVIFLMFKLCRCEILF